MTVGSVKERVDHWQQGHRSVGFVFGVVKKFGDDGGGQLAAQLTYYGFLSLFPLLLLLVTVLGLVAGGNPGLTHRIEHSALSQFPVIGNQLGASIHQLHQRSAVGLAIGILGLLWGSQGGVKAGFHAMAEVWNVPVVNRLTARAALVRTLTTFASVGVFLVASTLVAGAVAGGSHAPWAVVLAVILSLGLNFSLFAVAFRLLTPSRVGWSLLVPGSIVGGVGWSLLQYFGSELVNHTLRNSSQVYGFFAVVLGLLAWIYLGTQLFVYAAEINVVRARRLWPRSLVQPPLTEADRRVLVDVSLQSQQRPEQEISVSFASEPVPDREPSVPAADPETETAASGGELSQARRAS